MEKYFHIYTTHDMQSVLSVLGVHIKLEESVYPAVFFCSASVLFWCFTYTVVIVWYISAG